MFILFCVFGSRVNKAPAKIFKFLQRLGEVVAYMIFSFLKATEKTNKRNRCSSDEEKVLGSNSKFKTIKESVSMVTGKLLRKKLHYTPASLLGKSLLLV